MKQFVYLIAAFLTGSVATGIFFTERNPTIPTETIVRVYDTIPYYYPVARDSVVLRYETHRLPVGEVQRDTIIVVDSVEVVLPITQKEYQDSSYHLWISGYSPQLDSIQIIRRHDYRTITPPAIKPKRWHLGLSAGYAITSQGFRPYFGAGITYSFYSF